MSVGLTIRKLRKNKGYSIMKLRELTGLSKSTISEIENDKSSPTVNTLEKLSNALEVPLDYLLKKSPLSIIEDELEKNKVTLNELSEKTNLSIDYIKNIDNIEPSKEDYDKLKLISSALKIDYKELAKSLSHQEAPLYDGPTSTATEDFSIVSDSNLTEKEKLDIEKEAQKMINNIDRLDTVEFCGTPADEEDKEYLKLAYEKFLTDVRIYNKQKYTPKKYKK